MYFVKMEGKSFRHCKWMTKVEIEGSGIDQSKIETFVSAMKELYFKGRRH